MGSSISYYQKHTELDGDLADQSERVWTQETWEKRLYIDEYVADKELFVR